METSSIPLRIKISPFSQLDIETFLFGFEDSFAEGVEEFGVISCEDYVVIADRGLKEVVLTDLYRVFCNLYCNLGSAETVLIWIAGKLSLATEASLQIG